MTIGRHDLEYACIHLAQRNGYRALTSDPFAVYDESDGYRLRARHDCGAVTVAVFGADELVRWSEEQIVEAIASRLFGSCYCVRPETIVPCTAQRCEA